VRDNRLIRAKLAGMLRYAFLLAFLLVGTAATVRFRQPLLNTGREALAAARASLLRPENKSAAPISQAAGKRPTADSPEANADSPEAPADLYQATADRGSGRAAEEAKPSSSASHAETKGAPSEALRAPDPMLPAKVQSSITTDNTVAVRMRINRSGKVIRATVASASGPESSSVAHYAVATAYRWRFRPAQENGKPVPTEKVVEFLFRP
jgi:periplasmic protein TonB